MNAESAKAIAALLATVAVNFANAAGFALDGGTVANLLLSALSLAGVAWCWWRNQNVTQAAQRAQEYLDEMRKGA